MAVYVLYCPGEDMVLELNGLTSDHLSPGVSSFGLATGFSMMRLQIISYTLACTGLDAPEAHTINHLGTQGDSHTKPLVYRAQEIK